MLQTLFYIPHKLGPLPVFGWGWVLIAWVVFYLTVIAYTVWHQALSSQVRLSSQVKHHLTTAALMAAFIVFVIPWLEQRLGIRAADGNLMQGIPIRGYGLMLLVAIVSSVQLAIVRAPKFGLDAEAVYGLAMWMSVGGIVGARLFFVIQKWDQFPKGNLAQFLAAAVNVAEGGLVVYGSLIGATIAVWLFVSRHGLPVWKTADMIAPSLLLGLAIGRLGCLMNGCCYGGVCDLPWAIRFPPSSPPYEEQLNAGLLHGFRVAERDQDADANGAGSPVTFVQPQSPAEAAGLQVGQNVISLNVSDPLLQEIGPGQREGARQPPARSEISVLLDDGRKLNWNIAALPNRSWPIHPTQIYSAINAFVICLFLLAVTPYCRDGQVLAWLLTLYPISRFLLEMIRTDEAGFLGTGLTISQLISVGLLVLAVALWTRVGRTTQVAQAAKPLAAGH